MEHILWYTSPARYFEEAFVLGNGTLGATVYGAPEKDKIALNHDTLWSGKPRAYTLPNAKEAFFQARESALQGDIALATKQLNEGFFGPFGQSYMPLGNFYIETVNATPFLEYKRELDMENGIARVDYTTENSSVSREYFVSHPEKCICVRVLSSQPCDYILSMDCALKSTVTAQGNRIYLTGECPSMIAPAYAKDKISTVYDGEGIRFATVALADSDGGIAVEDNKLFVRNAQRLVVYICAETSYDGFDKKPNKNALRPCEERAEGLRLKRFEEIKRAHRLDFSALYKRVELDFGWASPNISTDERLKAFPQTNDLGLVELLFHYGRYLAISASRAGSQAMNLQGIWNEELFPPWSSNYTVNINTQMNYWHVFACDLAELNEPLVALVKKIAQTGEKTAREFYGADGFCLHHNVDLWGLSTPVGDLDSYRMYYAFFNGAGAWLCRHLWEQYEYTLDEAFLRETAYPIMKKATAFYLSVMVEDNGKYILCPSSSPENTYFSENGEVRHIAKYTAGTQAIVYDLFDNLIKASKVLGIFDGFTQKVESVLPKILTYQIRKEGQLIEFDDDYKECDSKHRHVTHLYGLYPGESITNEKTPNLARACRASLERRGDDTTGWATSWRVNLWAKLKDGERALALIKKQLSFVDCQKKEVGYERGGTYANMLDAHPPFQIDGNFGICAGVAQLLLQCENGKIYILPALPRELPNGSVKGLKAKGNVRVDIVWAEGELKNLCLLSQIDQCVCVVAPVGEKKISLKGGESFSWNP